jgi:serine/threonine protein kinase
VVARDEAGIDLEWIERLPEQELAERWYVRERGVPRTAWVMRESPELDNPAIAKACMDWRGFSHPRVSGVRHVGRFGGKLVVLVDDERGPSLADGGARLADTPVERERWLIAQTITIADALGAMAKRVAGFVYRDLDPSRLFVDATGRAGIRAPIGIVLRPRGAQTTGAGVVMGEPHWMSPEQALGTSITPASDVFALASNVVYAATGARPFDDPDGSFMAVLQKIISEPPRPTAWQTPGLDRVFARAFERDPKRRYPDPAAFGAALYDIVVDAGDYDAVVSDRLAEWWPTAPQAHGPKPVDRSVLCSKTWDELEAMTRPDMRFCSSCRQTVVRIDSLAAAIPLVGNTCINFKPRT